MWYPLTTVEGPCFDLEIDGRYWIVVTAPEVLQEVRRILPSCVDTTPHTEQGMREELVSRSLLDQIDGLVLWTHEAGECVKIVLDPPLLTMHWHGPALA